MDHRECLKYLDLVLNWELRKYNRWSRKKIETHTKILVTGKHWFGGYPKMEPTWVKAERSEGPLGEGRGGIQGCRGN